MSTAPTYDPFIVVPPFTACETAFIVFGQGTAPYSIFPIATSSSNASSLENGIPSQKEAGVFEWKCDFDSGANITWALTDAKGKTAFSSYRVVQTGSVSTCP
ncbi:hypothetical protein MNV49_005093 [Pseudohyphozyma bogoriensis]|nr:hypothetical protein MNV49_005093 [Pseudohyphozyma bogoriensis]